MYYPAAAKHGRAFYWSILSVLSLAVLVSQASSQRPFSFSRFNRNQMSLPRQSSYRDHCKTNYKFDYVQLTLMWAPGACSTSPKECVRVENRYFTVHGMWPTLRGTQEPSDCCFDNTFDIRALQPILPILDQYWFSYYDAHSNKGFWSHEWLKHGTCSRDIESLRGEARYFGNTVQIARQLPILESLNSSNIVPSNNKIYAASDIYKALKAVSQGKVLQISCDYEHNQPNPILTGLAFCFDTNMKPSDCPETKPKCQKNIIFRAS